MESQIKEDSMQAVTDFRAELETISLQIALAALQHHHAFGRPVIVEYVFFDNIDSGLMEEIAHGKKPFRFWGSVVEKFSPKVSHTFRCEFWPKPLQLGVKMGIDLRLDDGRTIVCGHAVLRKTKDGGIMLDVET